MRSRFRITANRQERKKPVENIREALAQVFSVLGTIRIVDVLDIAIVAFLIYELIMLVRKTRAAQLVKGILLLFVVSFLAKNLQMRTLSNILSTVLQFGVLALVIVFQPEIRRVLEQIGHTHIISLDLLRTRSSSEERRLRTTRAIAAVCDAVEQMSANRTGALIVFERKTNLSDILSNGTTINADVSAELLRTIFYEGTLLHDGAVIIRDGRVLAAACVLPLSANLEISKEMGTRHRAALGISENSDAVAVVVSEESGIVSLAKNGVLIRRLDRSALYKILSDDLLQVIEPSEKEKNHASRASKPAAKNWLSALKEHSKHHEAAGDEPAAAAGPVTDDAPPAAESAAADVPVLNAAEDSAAPSAQASSDEAAAGIPEMPEEPASLEDAPFEDDGFDFSGSKDHAEMPKLDELYGHHLRPEEDGKGEGHER